MHRELIPCPPNCGQFFNKLNPVKCEKSDQVQEVYKPSGSQFLDKEIIRNGSIPFHFNN